MLLQNRVNKKELKKRIQEETIKRITVSFYRYVIIDNPQELRDALFEQWNNLKILGRIYVAKEGINAQMSVPEEIGKYLNTTFTKILCSLESLLRLLLKTMGNHFIN
jgi:predicted sulfurtransferase